MPDIDAPDALSELIGRIASGDRDAFRMLYGATANRLFASAVRIVRNRALAEDVLQDTFIRVWRYSKTFKPDRARALPWLTQIMRNRAIDLRAHYGQEVSLDQINAERADRGESGIGRDGSERMAEGLETGVTFEIRDATLARCFEQLNGQDRQVLYLSFTYGMSHAEIAAHLRIPLGTAKTWCRQALIELKRRLDQHEKASTPELLHD